MTMWCLDCPYLLAHVLGACARTRAPGVRSRRRPLERLYHLDDGARVYGTPDRVAQAGCRARGRLVSARSAAGRLIGRGVDGKAKVKLLAEVRTR